MSDIQSTRFAGTVLKVGAEGWVERPCECGHAEKDHHSVRVGKEMMTDCSHWCGCMKYRVKRSKERHEH